MTPPEILQSESVHAVSVESARFGFDGVLLFDGLELSLERGRWTCLLGPSGVGKSSLLRVIAGLERLESGSLSVLSGASVAYMAQQDLLMPWLSALGNVSLGARLRGEKPDRERGARDAGARGFGRGGRRPAAHPFGRHAPAGRACPHPDGRPARRAHGRALLRARRDHARPGCRSSPRTCSEGARCCWSLTIRWRRSGLGSASTSWPAARPRWNLPPRADGPPPRRLDDRALQAQHAALLERLTAADDAGADLRPH